MNLKSFFLGFFAIVLLCCSVLFVCCTNDLNNVVTYTGQVVYIKTTTPFSNLVVKVTNGTNIHCQDYTDDAGMFSLKVKVNEIDGSYYLLAGDSTCIPQKVALAGYGSAEVDLGVIEVEGPALPVVVTHKVSSVTADAAICGGEVTSGGRLNVTARGVCYGTEVYPEVSGSHTKDGEGLGEFISTLKDLEHNTIYYARAYATNSMGTAYGEQVKFTTEEGVPVVVTDSVIRITANSARCKGHVESDGGYQVTKRGTCWSKRPDPTEDDECTDDGSGLGEFTSALKNLTPDTKYYVRTFAKNSTATVYGEQIIITTLDGLPVVTTDSVVLVTATGFTAHGTVVSDCDIPVTARGFCYSTSQYPTTDDGHTTSGKGLGTFKNTISQLEYGTTYYVRAYATNDTETSYGEQFTVTTLSGLPTVTTAQVTNIGSVKATCGGEVTDDGTLQVTARGICYGTEQQPTIADNHTNDGKGKGKFTSNITGLQDKTTYYVRAYATTDAGTSYGEERTFITENGIPVVIISELGEPTANSITCRGEVTGDGGVTLTERGFCYSTSQYPTNIGSHIAIGTGVGEFTGSLTGLAINTTYYIRAYAINSLGVGYSEQQSFTTKNGLATVTTGQATATATTINANGEVTGNGGFQVTERGICYSSINSEPTIVDSKIAVGSGNGVFNTSISGLSATTTYYVRAYATNINGTAYGAVQTIQTKSGLAVVTIGTITNITALSAVGSVTVTDANGASLQSCGICWGTTANPTIENSTSADGNQLNTAYTCNMANLTPNTTYYVRAYAITDVTTAYSSQVSFKTKDGLPTISTATTTATSTSITSGGSILSDGGYSITARGICYSTTNSMPTLTDNYTTAGIGTGTFSSVITSVAVSTTYYVRAYATNSIGTGYGEVITITTNDGKPQLTTTTPTLNGTTVITGGHITSDENYSIIARRICYGSLPNPDLSSTYNHTNDGIGTGYYTSTFSLPNGSGKYYIRAYATNANGTTYGDQIEVIQPYDELPSFVYNGNTYKVAPDPSKASNGQYMLNEYMSFNDAYSYCENLTAYGYSDWRMPTYDELMVMFQNRSVIGGFYEYSWIYYWSSTGSETTCHMWICFAGGGPSFSCTSSTESGNYRNYWYIHVRPIRVEE